MIKLVITLLIQIVIHKLNIESSENVPLNEIICLGFVAGMNDFEPLHC